MCQKRLLLLHGKFATAIQPLQAATCMTFHDSRQSAFLQATKPTDFSVSLEENLIDCAPFFARETRNHVRDICQLELKSTGLPQLSPGALGNGAPANPQFISCTYQRSMPPPIVTCSLKPAPHRLCSRPTPRCRCRVEMSNIFCMGDPLQIISSIVPFVEVLVVHICFLI